jgi:hypothetical protein
MRTSKPGSAAKADPLPSGGVSEAAGANIEEPGLERGHHTLVITRKGGKVVTIPLVPRTARAMTWRSASAPRSPLPPT